MNQRYSVKKSISFEVYPRLTIEIRNHSSSNNQIRAKR